MINVKKEMRILGVDDAPFTFRDRTTALIGTVFRGGSMMDGVLSAEIKVDGTDVTEKTVNMIKGSDHYGQLRLLMLDGITFGGFNIMDVETLHKKTRLPILVFISDRPDLASIRKSLGKFRDREKRIRMMESAGTIKSTLIENRSLKNRKVVYYQSRGLDSADVERIFRLTCVSSSVPEPLKAAHMIGYGIAPFLKR